MGLNWNRQERASISKHVGASWITPLKNVLQTFLNGNNKFAMAA